MSNEIDVDSFSEVYHGRWSVEEFYKIPKSYLEVENFHSKNIRGVKQELYASIVMVTIARILTNETEDSINNPKKRSEEIKKKSPKTLSKMILISPK